MQSRSRFVSLVWTAALMLGLCGCGSASGQEPTEAEMKDALLYAMNHPPGVKVSGSREHHVLQDSEACDAPTGAGLPLHIRLANLIRQHDGEHVDEYPGRVFLPRQGPRREVEHAAAVLTARPGRPAARRRGPHCSESKAARVRFSCPERVTARSSSMRIPPKGESASTRDQLIERPRPSARAAASSCPMK